MPNKQKNKDRKQNRRDQLPQFVRPLTGKAYKRERRAAEREQFRPQQRELQGEKRAEKETRHRIKDYFAQYGDAVQKAQTSSAAGYSDALNKTNAQAATSAATDSTIRDSIEAEAKRNAELRGATYTPSATSTQASANRRDSAALMAGLQATQGAAQNAYLADKQRVGAGEKRDQLLKSHERSRALNSDFRDLATAKKDFRRDYRSRTRDTERQFYLEQQQLAQTAKGQKTQLKLAKQYAKNDRKSQNRSLRNQQAITAQQDANERADDRRSRRYAKKFGGSKGGDKGGSGHTFSKARALIMGEKPATPAAAVDYLIRNGYPRGQAEKFVQRIQNLHNSTAQQQALHGTN